MKPTDYRFSIMYMGFCVIVAALVVAEAIRSLKPTVTISVPQVKTTVQVPQQAVLPDPRSFR